MLKKLDLARVHIVGTDQKSSVIWGMSNHECRDFLSGLIFNKFVNWLIDEDWR